MNALQDWIQQMHAVVLTSVLLKFFLLYIESCVISKFVDHETSGVNNVGVVMKKWKWDKKIESSLLVMNGDNLYHFLLQCKTI